VAAMRGERCWLAAATAAEPRGEVLVSRGGESETHRTAGGTAAKKCWFGRAAVSQRLTGLRAAQPRRIVGLGAPP